MLGDITEKLDECRMSTIALPTVSEYKKMPISGYIKRFDPTNPTDIDMLKKAIKFSEFMGVEQAKQEEAKKIDPAAVLNSLI